MSDYYPSRNDLANDDRLERTFRDAYTRIYGLQTSLADQVASVRRDLAATLAPVKSKLGTPLNLTWLVSTLTSAQFSFGPYGSRPVATTAENGRLYYATDQSVLYVVVAGTWSYLTGTMRGTLSPNTKPGLVAGDAGFLFYATDFDHTFRWSGAAWALAPGEDRIGEIRSFDGVVAPGTGWQLCDGSAVTRSTPTGGTAAVTVPDYSTSAYVKAGTVASIGPNAAGGATTSVSAGTPAGTITWPAGVPTFAGNALATHQHELPISFDSGGIYWPDTPPFGTGANITVVEYSIAIAFGPGTGAAPMVKAQSAGTPSGTISWPAGVPTFAGSALAGHDHGPGTLELRNSVLKAYYRL